MGTDGYQTYTGDHFIVSGKVKSLCSIPETNITLYINYIAIKKKKALTALRRNETD